MSDKDIFCMGRAEFLAESKGLTLTEASEIAESEWNEMHSKEEN